MFLQSSCDIQFETGAVTLGGTTDKSRGLSWLNIAAEKQKYISKLSLI